MGGDSVGATRLSIFERLNAVQEILVTWAASFGTILIAFALFGGAAGHAKVVATVGFLYLPLLAMRRRGEDYADFGITFRAWREDLRLFSILFALVLPLYVAGFWAFAELLPHLPSWLGRLLSPYTERPTFALRLPDRFGEWVIDNLLVVGLPEEFFYRGYMTLRFEERWKPIPSAVAAAALFAVGHLLTPAPWRLAVFFPALLFAWLRNRTGTIVGASIAHFLSNVWLLILERSAFG
jgi:membrane protease YdiL (CAAX protease family)